MQYIFTNNYFTLATCVARSPNLTKPTHFSVILGQKVCFAPVVVAVVLAYYLLHSDTAHMSAAALIIY